MASKKGIRDYPSYEFNPFRIAAGAVVKGRVPTGEFVDSYEVSELERHVVHKDNPAAINLNDKQNHIRLYNDAILKLPELSSSATKILCYIFIDLATGRDEVRLHAATLIDELKFSHKTSVYSGILDLLDHKFIVKKSGRDMFFINPAFFFRMGRARWYKKTQEFDELHTEGERIYPPTIKDTIKKKNAVKQTFIEKDHAAKLEHLEKDFVNVVMAGSPFRTISSLPINSFFTIDGTEYLLFLIEDSKYYGADEIAQGIPDDRLKRKFATVFTGSEVIE